GAQAEAALDKAGMTVNKNMIPDDPRKPMDPSGIRLGTPAITTRGLKETEMKQIVAWIDQAIANHEDEAKLSEIKNRVKEMASKFPLYPDLQY
ncbi:serine hydroxymethyltransferase, partial [Patescibacteria group bacterium]|nr:serine hydroxymethyltransferase [Patescibacteria group bacterium]